jgi:hypothetical protein
MEKSATGIRKRLELDSPRKVKLASLLTDRRRAIQTLQHCFAAAMSWILVHIELCAATQ